MKRNLFVFLLSLLSLNLFCQVHWTKHPDNPVMEPDPEDWDPGSVGPMSVLYFDNAYHMWYDGYGEANEVPHASGYATSLDGITWIKDTANPVIVRGDPGEWDEWWMSDPVVYRTDTMFHMWYVGDDSLENKYGGTNPKIGHATSKDGINWTKDLDNPVPDLAESIDSSNFMIHSIVVHDGSLFHMYFASGRRPQETYDIYHAVSENLHNWTVFTNTPVISNPNNTGAIFPMSVIYNGSQFLMWYHTGNNNVYKTYMAYSQDGIQWESYPHPVLVPGPYGSWDYRSITRSVVLYDSVIHQFKMWYSGSSRSHNPEEAIGYAVSDTCYDFTIPEILCDFLEFDDQDSIEVKSTEDGLIYLCKSSNSYSGLDSLRTNCIDSVEVISEAPAWIHVAELRGNYSLFAVDKAKNISHPHDLNLTTIPSSDGIYQHIVVHPNPAKDIVNVKVPVQDYFYVRLYNLNGQEIYRSSFSGNVHGINIKDFPDGIYFITIRSKDYVTTKKIIKL